MESFISCFSNDGDYLSILSVNANFKVWNTKDGSLFAEWKMAGDGSEFRFSCMACSFSKRKRKKNQGSYVVAFGTDDGDILATDILTGEIKWRATGGHSGGVAGLSFANKGCSLHVVGADGWASEMNSENGELMRKFKISKRSISSSAFSFDGKFIAAANTKIQVSSFENGDELLKFSSAMGPVQGISISENADFIVTSSYEKKQLKVWKCDMGSKAVSSGPELSMRHPPVAIECNNGCNGEDILVVLSISESGVAYIWNLDTKSWEDVTPTKIMVKATKAEKKLASGGGCKSHSAIIASRLQSLGTEGVVKVIFAYGSINCPRFNIVEVTRTGESITLADGDEITKGAASLENEVLGKDLHDEELERRDEPALKEKVKKKRVASDPDSPNPGNSIDNGQGHSIDGVQLDDLNEPTMGEKIASLNLVDNNQDNIPTNIESSPRVVPPSADSVHVVLKQALHADDRALLFDCLSRREEKIIENSVSMLNPSDVLRLLESLISLIQSRGAVLAHALPWLKSLLLQHASGIMAQESSLQTLNTLYQLIESRVSTFDKALKLSSHLDLLYAATVDDRLDGDEKIVPVIYEDKDESEEEGSEDAMETDTENDSNEHGTFEFTSDDGMVIDD